MQLTTNHPARCAERIASLDLLSNGRCEFGMGESASITELEPFGVDIGNKREIFEEAVRAIMPMFRDGPSEHHAKYFNMPLRHVMPKPMQKPHPPLWVACSQLDTLAKCGEWGMGALGFQFVSADAAHAWVHAYYNSFVKRQKKLADYRTNPNIALVSFFMCANTDLHAAALRGGLIGSPETIRRKLAKFQSSNIDQVVLLNQAGKNTHEHICESLELFAKEVMPEFQGAHPQLLKWKEQVLNREIELEEIDTTAFKERFGGNMKPITPDAPKVQAAE